MNEIVKATLETLYMVLGSGLCAALIGVPLGIVLLLSRKEGLKARPQLYAVLDFAVNILRSFPFIILIVLIMPLSKLLIGRFTGPSAMIVSLSVAAAPFVARVVEQALSEVARGKIEAALAMGAGSGQIVRSVLIPEAAPALASAFTLTLINIIGYSALAGAIGGGGLGDLAIRYGLYNRQPDKLYIGCLIIILLVQLVQWAGNRLAKAIDHR